MLRKTLLVVLITAKCILSDAQNVGIGTPTPSEKLDVNGSINITGTIKANGTDGSANQVLMKNSTGSLAWGDLSSYKNFMGYSFSNTFIVPTGVTTILAEVWGGGGGGNALGGGGSGGYGMALVPVIPGETIAITIGSGGNFAVGTAVGGNGGTTMISGNQSLSNFSVSGGFGALSLFPGNGGGSIGASNNVKYINCPGERGMYNTESYVQSAAGVFLHIINYGRGGHAPNANPNGGAGALALVNESNGSVVSYQYPGQGLIYGGGGGGGRDNGSNGGYGYVILHW